LKSSARLPSVRIRTATQPLAVFPDYVARSRWYQDRYQVDIDPESEAIVTIGSKEGWRT
jgi:aspartate/methionine/tyrosine aminotransferase